MNWKIKNRMKIAQKLNPRRKNPKAPKKDMDNKRENGFKMFLTDSGIVIDTTYQNFWECQRLCIALWSVGIEASGVGCPAIFPTSSIFIPIFLTTFEASFPALYNSKSACL